MRFSDQELAEFRFLIQSKLKEAKAALEELRESLDASNENTSYSTVRDIDDAADATEKEFLIVMMERQKKHIRSLEQALIRIENKTYGICRATGQLIDQARLRVVPHATLSVAAKNHR